MSVRCYCFRVLELLKFWYEFSILRFLVTGFIVYLEDNFMYELNCRIPLMLEANLSIVWLRITKHAFRISSSNGSSFFFITLESSIELPIYSLDFGLLY